MDTIHAMDLTGATPNALPAADASRRLMAWQWVALAIIVAAATAVRFVQIDRMSLHADEAWHLELAMGRGAVHDHFAYNQLIRASSAPTRLEQAASWTNIWNSIQGITHPPLYGLALRGWCEIFGTSDRATRGFSAMASVFAVLVLFDLARRLFGTSVALWAAGIMAMASPQIELAQEVRPYSLLTLLCLLTADLLVIVEQSPRRWWHLPALALAVTFCMLTHYFAIGVMLGLGTYTIAFMRGRARWHALLAFALAAVMFAAVWLPNMLEQRKTVVETADNWLKESPEGHALRTLKRLMATPLQLLVNPDIARGSVKYASIGIIIAAFALLPRRRDLALPCCWLAGTLGLVAALDWLRHTRHLDFARYVLPAGPGLYALLAALTLRSRPLIRHLPPAITIVSCLCALPAMLDLVKRPYRHLAEHLDAHVRRGDVVVIFNYFKEPWTGRMTWLGIAHYSKSYPWPFMVVDGPFNDEVKSQLSSASGVWVVAPPGAIHASDFVPGAEPEHRDYVHGVGETFYAPPPRITSPAR